ncbi:L,D-transpeptidase family protein [Methylobacterium brachythecii]|uniref:Lipoprotein-anchoring transpeptidase ErfK/SrfK n=1 Tax=Methylobacterium brachythecii TaxID=1176177 RepID=A0A7W6F6E9_9HYPH|nr:L,D-transpeptidase [Methylobacterium brachythecii]MBB3902299.1 lipoprotein-anchoring transpeptidase ErfK/SrfK [Methylobacterium brachythecii]GLS42147.1 murein L,D-transpeptidase [Methylobacterium brachythecii]
MNGYRVFAGVVLLELSCLAGPAWAKKAAAPEPAPLTIEAINGATFAEPKTEKPSAANTRRAGKDIRPDPLLIKVQVLLDRARFSPGAIDGRDGDNLKGALQVYAGAQGLPAAGGLDRAVFDKLQATSADPVVTSYTITDDDVRGPFAKIPPKLEKQRDLKSMDYTNVREMLAERFHMQRDLLSALNPGKALDEAGTVITVAAVPPLERGKPKDLPAAPKVTRIEVDKQARRVQAFGEDGALLRSYPASIGSEEKPAPTGSFKATRAAFDPWYTYNPKYAFKGVKTRRSFKIAPGPNNPVGLVWIDLSIPSYGIHGTPEPEKVGKTESHGCIRLTNWDARDLASHVQKNAKVDFLDK